MTRITVRRAPWRSRLTSPFTRDSDAYAPGMRRMFDSLFDTPFDGTELVGHIPAVEISETDKAFTCIAELPGLKLDDVNVSFDDGILTIKGEKRDEREEQEEKRYHVIERSYGMFERSFTFPNDIDPERITAQFRDGVLTIVVPKATIAKTGARRIAIQPPDYETPEPQPPTSQTEPAMPGTVTK